MKRVFILFFCTTLLFNSQAQQNNLDYFVNQAIANSPLLKDFQNQILSFTLDSQIMRAGRKLQMNGLLRKEDSLLKKLTQDNAFKQNEYLGFVVILQQQLLTTSQLETQYDFDYAALNYLAGIVDTTTTRLEDPQLNSKTFGDFTN